MLTWARGCCVDAELCLFLDQVQETRLNKLPPHSSTAAMHSKADTKLLTNHFVGFGLCKLIDSRKINDAAMGDEDVSQNQSQLARSMQTFHHQALVVPTCLAECCCDKTQALKNNGFLALLVPKHFLLGLTTMKKVLDNFTEDIFKQHRWVLLLISKTNGEVASQNDCREV